MRSVLARDSITYDELASLVRSGTYQALLSRWYLAYIEDATSARLARDGVALPVLTNPPRSPSPDDVAAARKNNTLLSALLALDNQQAFLARYVRPVTAVIYPVVRGCIQTFRALFFTEFGVPPQTDPCSVTTPPRPGEQLDFAAACKDYAYLTTLLDEERWRSSDEGLETVTIVGLVFNVVLRMLCETKTCLERWGVCVC